MALRRYRTTRPLVAHVLTAVEGNHTAFGPAALCVAGLCRQCRRTVTAASASACCVPLARPLRKRRRQRCPGRRPRPVR
jgi:hypothetical protein